MLPILELIRLEETEAYGTFGVLKIQKEVFCVTLEPADRLNKVSVSLIPAQQYLIKRHQSPRYGETFKVQDVTDRTAILFHPGNIVAHTQGCILLGQYFGKLRDNRAILNSGNTFREFMRRLEGHNVAHLTIKEIY